MSVRFAFWCFLLHECVVVTSTLVDAAEVIVVGELRDRQFSARNVLVRVPG